MTSNYDNLTCPDQTVASLVTQPDSQTWTIHNLEEHKCTMLKTFVVGHKKVVTIKKIFKRHVLSGK